MASLCYFPSCVSVSSRNLSLTHHHQLLHPRRRPNPSLIRASAIKKTRRSRKIKSDAELCNDIREFVAAVGLPQDHVPSTKELLQHGRSDLANIVRRRGYKLLRELLTSSLSSNIHVFNTDESLDENLDGSDDCKDLLAGQNLKVDIAGDDITASTTIHLGNNSSCLNSDSSPSTDDPHCISIESSAYSSMEEIDLSQLKHHADDVNHMAEGFCDSTGASVDYGLNSDSSPSTDDPNCISVESSAYSSGEEIDLSELKHHADEANHMAEGFCDATGASVDYGLNSDSSPSTDDPNCILVETSAYSSAEEIDLSELKHHADEVNHMAEGFCDTAGASVDYGLNSDSSPSTNDPNCILVESSAYSSVEEIDLSELKHHAEEVNHIAEGFSDTTGASVDYGCSSSSRGPDLNSDNQSSIAAETSGESSAEKESSVNFEYGDNMMNNMIGEITLSSTAPLTESHSNTSFADSDRDTHHSCESEDPDDSIKDIAENVPSSTEVFITENVAGGTKISSIVHSADNSCINVNSSANLSLEEKAAKFIQSGELDPVEDHAFGILNGNSSEENEVHIESGSAVEIMSNIERFEHPAKDNTAMELNGNSLTSKQLVPSATIGRLVWDDNLTNEDQAARFDEDLHAEVSEMENQSEINRLKFMLYQKELELSQLKEQIEKEKLALSVLQTKAEEEINKARKLISEKDAELHVAEESLSELKEVQIEFCGDGDNVEVTGSFNGWHHRIKMDPQSPSVIDPTASRRSRLWSTVLWLYPGVYEIKFVVDGHWRIDPQRESYTKGHISNNILRVDR